MRLKKFHILLTILFFISVAAVFFITKADSRANYAATFGQHVGIGNCIDWTQQDVVGEATSTITTRCTFVEACIAVTDTVAATTTADLVVCNVPTQTGSNMGKVKVSAHRLGSTASGTTSLNVISVGYGSK